VSTPTASDSTAAAVTESPTDYDETYLTSSEPVQTTSAPVWVVPGILLVLVGMLAVLGGVLGRGNRPVLARVRSANRDDERPAPGPPAAEPLSMFKPAPAPDRE
jgi:hypothetical protein